MKKASEQTVANSQPVPVVYGFQDLPLDLLDASPLNPRKTFDEGALKELAASIANSGVLVPLIVRPVDLEGVIEQRFEIVAGHRRSEAATLAGLDTVPCIVRNLTDAEARDAALVDNLQRVDVPALEEAEAFGELLRRYLTIPAVAAAVGKEQAHVAKRLKLLTLTLCSRDALREQLITIDHASLLARLAEAEQNDALKWCLDPQAGSMKPVPDVVKERLDRRRKSAAKSEEDFDEDSGRRSHGYQWEPPSVQQLKSHIECKSGEPLDRAPWPMAEDYLLPDAGSCLDCPKNTKANAPLFGDLDMGVAVCTDGACFKAKVSGFVQLKGRDEARAEAARKGQPPEPGAFEPLRVSWKSTSTAPRFETVQLCACKIRGHNCKTGEGCRGVPKLGQVFKDGQWIEAKKKCEYARTGITVDWSDANNRGYMGNREKLRKPGEIVRVCIEPKCKTHPKAYVKATAANRGESEQDLKKQAADRARWQAFEQAEKHVRRALYEQIQAKIRPDTLKRNALLAMQNSFKICIGNGFGSENRWEREKYTQDLIAKASGEDLDALLFHATFGAHLVVNGNDARAKDKGRGPIRELAKVVGVDAAAIERKLDEPQKPEAAAKPATKAPAKKTVKTPAKKTAAKPAKKAAKKAGAK